MNMEAINKRTNRKTWYDAMNILFCVLLLLPVINRISLFQFSDGIPMLHRLLEFTEGNLTIGDYFFGAHGNSVHALVYFAALLDNMLFGNNAVLLRICVYVGMSGAALLVSSFLYNEDQPLLTNIFVAFIIDILIMGGFHIQLYLPFQMVLTFSRWIFLIALSGMTRCLYTSTNVDRKWIVYLAISCLAAPLHGMGMMFAGSIFYLHIITKQCNLKKILSLFPFICYTILQITFNSGYGEAGKISSYLPKYLNKLIGCLGAYYGGVCSQLIQLPRRLAFAIGMIIWIFSAIVLGLYFFQGFPIANKVKPLEKVKKLNEKETFLIGMLGISFLASLGAATFTAARIDLLEYTDPIGIVMCLSDRYQCFSIVPYIIFLYFFLKYIPISKIAKSIYHAILIITLVFFLYKNAYLTNKTCEFNKKLDLEATAMLTGFSMDAPELGILISGFNVDKYWKDQMPILFQKLESKREYIWEGLPALHDTLDITDKSLVRCTRASFTETSESDKSIVILESNEAVKRRYAAVINQEGIVAGFVYRNESPRLFRYSNDKRIYFNGNYQYKGYILSEYISDSYFYILDTKNIPNFKDGMLHQYSNIQLCDLTNEDGWERGIMKASSVLLFENTPENRQKLDGCITIANGENVKNVVSIQQTQEYIHVFVQSNVGLESFSYPNVISLYKY